MVNKTTVVDLHEGCVQNSDRGSLISGLWSSLCMSEILTFTLARTVTDLQMNGNEPHHGPSTPSVDLRQFQS